MSCPPHDSGPAQFRQWQEQSLYAMVLRLDVPAAVMLSKERLEVMQLRHAIVAALEQKAVQMGYK
jgi:hypothetical protein